MLLLLGKLYFVRINAINNLTNDVELKWKVDETNGIIITESASKFIISGENQQIISLKFRKNKPTKSENQVESIQFSALDIKSQKSLFVNSLHTFAMNATDFLLEPIDLIIKKPCKYHQSFREFKSSVNAKLKTMAKLFSKKITSNKKNNMILLHKFTEISTIKLKSSNH